MAYFMISEIHFILVNEIVSSMNYFSMETLSMVFHTFSKYAAFRAVNFHQGYTNCGVPQGFIIGRIFFDIYISDTVTK